MVDKRQRKLFLVLFVLLIIFVSLGLVVYCGGGACSSATEETAEIGEEGASDYSERDAEQDDRRIPSSNYDESDVDNSQSESGQ